jgi:hypothetical protein
MKIKECQLLTSSIFGAILLGGLALPLSVSAQTCQELADKTKTDCEAKGKKDVWYKSAFLGFNLTDGNSETILLKCWRFGRYRLRRRHSTFSCTYKLRRS